MRKFIRFCVIAALVMLAAGLLLSVVVSAVKGREYVEEFLDEVTDGKSRQLRENVKGLETSEIIEKVKDSGEKLKDQGERLKEETAEKYKGLEGYDINDSTIFEQSENIESGTVDKAIENLNALSLNAELGGCTLEIVGTDQNIARIVAENAGKLQFFEKDRTLNVKFTGKGTELLKDSKVILYLPAGYEWQEVELTVGAGMITAQNLIAAEAELEVGGGQITVDGLKAGKAEVSVGAGEIRLTGLNADYVDAGVGAGNVVINGSISKGLEGECSMGNMEFVLNAAETDYNYELECVAGNIDIGGNSYSGGMTSKKRINNGASALVELECSMGNISVDFMSGS